MTRPTIRSMVTGDLGYCCLWFFFSRFRKTGLIAARLGVSRQAICVARNGCGGCQLRTNCMDRRVTVDRRARKLHNQDEV